MDILLPILICIVFFVIISVCGWCCKRKREGQFLGYGGTGVTVTTQHVTQSPVVVPPYPVNDTRQHAPPYVPVPAPPQPGFAGAVAYPPTTGAYPPVGAAPYNAPYPVGGAPYPGAAAPYPTGSVAHPPTYFEATGQHMPPQHTVNEEYSKQAPFNPHY